MYLNFNIPKHFYYGNGHFRIKKVYDYSPILKEIDIK